ncbi:CaiB/BaiF CoA transferase family protein [Rhodococcus koreensis]
MSSEGLLDGIRVLDLTQALLGPAATQMLGDYGAEVIKVERGGGDLMRFLKPDRNGPDNPIFLSLNRNKRSISLDTRTDDGRAVVLDLVRNCDVMVSNFRPGVMERIGLDYESLREINPRLIWASGTGFGSAGPYVAKGGVDQMAQALTGLMARRNSDDEPPTIYPTMICDYTAAMHLLQGILLALFARERTGRGQRVEVSLYDSALAMQAMEATVQLTRGEALNFGRMPLNGVYATTDGFVVMLGVFHDNALRDISAGLDLGEDLTLREEFATAEKQFENREKLQAIFRAKFATRPSDEWLSRLESHDVKCCRVETLGEALNSEQTSANGMILSIDHPIEGEFRTVGSPISLSEHAMEVRYAPPRLGEHSDELLEELGYSGERIARLHGAGVVK